MFFQSYVALTEKMFYLNKMENKIIIINHLLIDKYRTRKLI